MVTVDYLWRLVRLQFLLLAEGGSMNLNGEGGHVKPGSKPPPKAGEDIRALDRDWAGCVTEADKRVVLMDAMAILATYLLPNPDVRRKRGTREWKEAIAFDPRASRTVARMYGVGKDTVLRYRKELKVGDAD